jgi:hypothetical protein
MRIRTFKRDAAILEFMNGYLVNTCDSAGGIGELEMDILNVDIQTVALSTLKVAFLENLTLGSKILSVSATFMNSPKYAQSAIESLSNFLKKWKIPLVVSTEKNFSTIQTRIGAGVVGFAKKLRIGGAKPNYGVYVIVAPKVGKEVIENAEEVVRIGDVTDLMKLKTVGEIIPVGSKGIIAEAENLAENSGLRFVSEKDEEWMHKSAGPATCAVFWSKELPLSKKKIRRIGWLQ